MIRARSCGTVPAMHTEGEAMERGQDEGDGGERGGRQRAWEDVALLMVGVALVGVGAAAVFAAGRLVC